MGIYDRDYYRDNPRGFSDQTSLCVKLIAITAVMFVVQLLTREQGFDGFRARPVEDALILDVDKVHGGQVWRLLTHAFLHGSFYHLFCNMLLLYVGGREVERIYGPREFLSLYLFSAVLAGCGYTLAHSFGDGRGPSAALGASGAVAAVFVVFAMHYPHHTLYLFFVLPVPVWLIAVGLFGFDLYRLVTIGDDRVGVSAHVTGAVFGFLYQYYQWRVSNWIPNFAKGRQAAARRRTRPSVQIYREPEPEPTPVAAPKSAADEQLEAQLDAVLEKVSRHGKGSLTDEEQAVLNRASEVFKRRRQ